jgi:hypothetical protein
MRRIGTPFVLGMVRVIVADQHLESLGSSANRSRIKRGHRSIGALEFGIPNVNSASERRTIRRRGEFSDLSSIE